MDIKYIGIGVTPSAPDEQIDVDVDTFNLGEHTSLNIIIVSNDDDEFLVEFNGEFKFFNDEYDKDDYINHLIATQYSDNLGADIVSVFYYTCVNDDIDEDDVDFISEELNRELVIEPHYLSLDKKYSDSIFSYIVSDTLEGLSFVGKELVADEKIDFYDIDEYRNDEDNVIVVTSI